MRFLKKRLLLISLLVVVVLALLVGMPIVDRQDDYAVDLDGVVLPRVGAGTDHEIVGETGHFLKVEDFDV